MTVLDIFFSSFVSCKSLSCLPMAQSGTVNEWLLRSMKPEQKLHKQGIFVSSTSWTITSFSLVKLFFVPFPCFDLQASNVPLITLMFTRLRSHTRSNSHQSRYATCEPKGRKESLFFFFGLVSGRWVKCGTTFAVHCICGQQSTFTFTAQDSMR